MAADSEQWRDWLSRHGPALVLFARQWTSSVADAQDAVQDGFIRFWLARSRARDSVAYLYACVRSAAMDVARANRRREKSADRSLAANVPVSPFAAEQAELAQTIEEALAQLPSEQREVVVMKVWGGLTFGEIAEALRISPNTAASRYRYAIERLERALSESDVLPDEMVRNRRG